jgi:hypothetical protein
LVSREANLLFKAVDVLGIVPNQFASITQTEDEVMCSCWTGVLNGLAHLGDATEEERPPFRIRENRRIEETTTAERVNAIFRPKILTLVRGGQEGKRAYVQEYPHLC